MSEPQRFHIEQTVGEGEQCAYLMCYPSQQVRIPGLGIVQPSPMKIGHAQGDLQERIALLAAGSPEEPVVALMMRCPDGQLVERALHARLKPHRIKGEWFRTTAEDVLSIYMELGRPQFASLGEMLRHYRRAAGLSQSALGRAAAVRQELISRIETGHDGVAIATVENIANELGLRLTLVQKDDPLR